MIFKEFRKQIQYIPINLAPSSHLTSKSKLSFKSAAIIVELIPPKIGRTFVILTAEGAPGNPGWQVLNSLTGLKLPLPKQLMPATLNL